ncbi:hypothetical protein GYMLUDRAFT_252494 [Collybiopsis luxurians FD-317 M1]|uniref:Uncharacterized protein n=1 Tax=Collybiopsis luxurians FD-317 M1 TaxID=944289 RepID=A0A0D0B9U0_9AGAR|nr:hypothetical protein GYMLUDRAFT_252494 [Collybiopsis luxurians FD-317 M1]
MKDTSESLFHIGVSDSIHALSLITITIKNNRYYKLGVVPNDPEGDVIFPSFKLQGVIGQLDLEPVSASTNMSKLYHLQRCVQLTSVGSVEFANPSPYSAQFILQFPL